jgi:hypothetical protein
MCWNDHNSYSEPLMSSVAFNTAIERYLDHLRTEGVDEPLTESFTLAAVLDDLCRLAEVRLAAGKRDPKAWGKHHESGRTVTTTRGRDGSPTRGRPVRSKRPVSVSG